VRDIRFNGTYSRAVRAPNIGELFSGGGDTFQFIDDPCNALNLPNGTASRAANCATLLSGLGVANPAAFQDTRTTNIQGFLGGNPNLSEEAATTWTAGVILQPRFARGLSVRADWYDIKLKNAINFVTPQESAELCVDQPSLNNPFCGLVTRSNAPGLAGLIIDFNQIPQNVAQFRTAGLDLNVNYNFEIAPIGRFNASLVANYLDRLEFIGTPGAPVTNSRGEGFAPKYQAKFDLSLKTGSVVLKYGLSWFDNTLRYTNQVLENNPTFVDDEFVWIKERWVHDIYGAVDVNDRFQIYAGVNNVFGQRPDYLLSRASDLGTEDYPVSAVGRFFYAGAKVNFRGF
jgi:outer membrane receptor protein involved in Fe transport